MRKGKAKVRCLSGADREGAGWGSSFWNGDGGLEGDDVGFSCWERGRVAENTYRACPVTAIPCYHPSSDMRMKFVYNDLQWSFRATCYCFLYTITPAFFPAFNKLFFE